MTEITTARIFSLPEYERAFQKFIHIAIQAVMSEKEPLLGQIKKVRMPQVPVFRNTLPSGAVVENEPVQVNSPFNISIKDVISGNLESVLVAIDSAAEDGIGKIMPQFFQYLDRLSDAAGTATDAGGRPPSFELYLEALEKMDIDFDADGKPIMPTLVMHPDMAQALLKLPPPTAAQNQRLADLIQRKKQQHNDRRRSRKLSR